MIVVTTYGFSLLIGLSLFILVILSEAKDLDLRSRIDLCTRSFGRFLLWLGFKMPTPLPQDGGRIRCLISLIFQKPLVILRSAKHFSGYQESVFICVDLWF